MNPPFGGPVHGGNKGPTDWTGRSASAALGSEKTGEIRARINPDFVQTPLGLLTGL